MKTYTLLQQGGNQESIALRLGQDASTVSRELRRNQHAGKYPPEKAAILRRCG